MRYYGQWAGNPSGTPEDPKRCIQEVSHLWGFAQCSRSRGHGENGDYCKQHAREHPANEVERLTLEIEHAKRRLHRSRGVWTTHWTKELKLLERELREIKNGNL